MTISAAELLGWDDIARRDLPWRNPGITAWQILVSVFMLAQTPAARWPTPSATAATSVADVLRARGKLGSRWRAR